MVMLFKRNLQCIAPIWLLVPMLRFSTIFLVKTRLACKAKIYMQNCIYSGANSNLQLKTLFSTLHFLLINLSSLFRCNGPDMK